LLDRFGDSLHPRRILPFLGTLLNGAVLGVVLWVMLDTLGISNMLGVSYERALVGAAIVGVLAAALKLHTVLWGSLVATTIVLLVVAFTPLMEYAAHRLIRRDVITSPVDAIAVLSGGINADGILNDESMDRLLTGLDLHERHPEARFVISRVWLEHHGQYAFSNADQDWVVHLVDRNLHVFAVDSVHSTRDEAQRMYQIARTQHWKRIALVTSPLHTHRACAAFERVGFQVNCVPSRSSDLAVIKLDTARDRIVALQLWIYEIAGWVKYRWLGWV
jgi:uncharacterized SAM-binding protein YcdF (DUF218 family)